MTLPLHFGSLFEHIYDDITSHHKWQGNVKESHHFMEISLWKSFLTALLSNNNLSAMPWATKSLSQQPSLHIWMGCCLEGREMRGEHRRGQNRSGVKWSRRKQWTFLFHLLFPSLIKCISLAPLNVFLSLLTFFSWIIVTVITDGQRNIVSDERM